MPRRFAALVAFLVLTVALLSITVWVLLEERAPVPSAPAPAPRAPVPAPEPELVLEPAAFADLRDWAEDDLSGALPTLLSSCDVLEDRPREAPVGHEGIGGVAGDWLPVCGAIRAIGAGAPAERVREILESALRPWAVTDRGVERFGLVTGYYEPELHGSRRRQGAYQTPLYRAPRDLIAVDLGRFRDDLVGRRIAGRLVGRTLEPYHDREAIDDGALAGRGLELVWVDDPVDAFFLQVQGSGRVVLEDGTVLRVGYAGQNGHPYTAIGRELVARDELAMEEVSLQSIRRWLESHPEQAAEVMAANASYVFFRRLDHEGDHEGPLGSLGVALTPGRSLAVDPRFVPLGAPVWLDGSMPWLPAGALDGESPGGPRPTGSRPLRRLLVAQDTGGAIRGPVRGDLFWGAGARAEAIAGHMKHPGRLWVLLPAGLDPTLE